MIISWHSKSSNYLVFNPILQKFCEMICEITVHKMLCGIFLIFCRSSFINNFMVKNNFLKSKNHWKLNISRTIYFKKISSQRFVDLICTNKLEVFFFQKIFLSRSWGSFHECKTTNLGPFFPQKIDFILFFKGDYLILI